MPYTGQIAVANDTKSNGRPTCDKTDGDTAASSEIRAESSTGTLAKDGLLGYDKFDMDIDSGEDVYKGDQWSKTK